MIWSAGPDGGCDYVNAAWRTFTGRALDDELGDGWQEGIHPDDRAEYLALYRDHVRRREPFEAGCRLRGGDGVYRSVVLRAGPRKDGDGAFAGFVASVSATDDQAGDSAGLADFFELLLDHLCVAGFDGYWKQLNPSWTRTLGWTKSELLSRPVIDFVHPDDREATLTARGGLKLGEPLRSLTNRYRCKDGSYRWFEWRSVSDMDRELVYAVARDVTAEHDVRRALGELTENLRTTLDSIAEGVIATDATASIARMNPVAEALTGWAAADAVGRPLGEVFVVAQGDSQATLRVPIDRTLHERLASEGATDTRLVARDGTELPIVFSRAPMQDPEGEVSGAVIVFRDMSDERRARQRQERLQQQLMLADRMASVGTLAEGVAHEINNPLAYVMANLEMILEELRDGDVTEFSARRAEWIEMADEARHGADRIRRIVSALSTFSRAEQTQRALLDVEPVLEQSLATATSEIGPGARLVKDYGDMPRVDADGARLGEVFVNLFINAAEAVSEVSRGGHEIRVVTSTDASGNAVVEFSDTGPGIPEAAIDRVFDPFFTTKPIGIGTGLGLAICHGIVSSMGGQLTARNRDGGGAIFRVTLPPAVARHAAAPPAAPPKSPSAPARAAVLVVDDEPAVAVSLKRVLRAHDVTTVSSAREALDLVDAGASYDIILSDLMMPGMSGMELHDAIRERRAELAERIVFITGGAFTASAHAFLERVPNERLDKPFDPASVRALVERFLAPAS